MTNWDKVKENISISTLRYKIIEEENPTYELCEEIEKIRGRCVNDCETCLNWLTEEYKEPPKPMLTDKEREYLSAVIKPWRDDVQIIKKMETTCGPEELETYIPKEYIVIITKELDNAVLPCFEKGKWYKGMETTDGYTLEELGL